MWLLRELFRRRDGGVELRINPSRGMAELTFVPARFDLRAYLAEAERFGYRFGPRRKEERPHVLAGCSCAWASASPRR